MQSSRQAVEGALLGLIVGYVIVLLLAVAATRDPVAVVTKAYYTLTSPRSLEYLVSLWGPVGLAALGLTLCYRAGFITIAVEGQILAGMLVSLWLLAYVVPEADPVLGIALALAISALVGVLLGAVPVVLRVYFNANEILVTLMMNLAIVFMVAEIVSSYLRVGAFVITKPVPEHFRLSWVWAPIFLAIALVIVWFIESRTSLGLAAKVYGSSRRTAVTYGVSELALFFKLSALSGALAGIGGALAMLVFQYFLGAKPPVGFGYSGVLAAWLSGFSPPVAVASSLLLSYMRVWAYAMMAEGVHEGFVLGSQTIVVVFSLVGAYAARYLRREVAGVA
ncbi:MAG: hypothetical protein QXS85_01780 [Acidilobaceae archaeon]